MNKKSILVFVILILVGFGLSTGIVLPCVFFGDWWFLAYTFIAGIIFGCFEQHSNLLKYLLVNFFASIIFSFVCVFGEIIFIILKKIFPADQYGMANFKVDLEIALSLAFAFFMATLLAIFLKIFLVKHKEWFLTYKK